MRDVGHGQLQALLQRADLLAHAAAQPRVQVGQRLVEQQHAGLQHQRARHRHALLLPAGELARQALLEAGQAHQLHGRARALRRCVARQALHRQAVAHVLDHVHVREQRVALEHHADVALGGAQRGDVLSVDEDGAGGGRLQPGDHAQRGGLAATRGAEDGGQRALGNLQVDALDHQGGAGVAVALGDLAEFNADGTHGEAFVRP